MVGAPLRMPAAIGSVRVNCDFLALTDTDWVASVQVSVLAAFRSINRLEKAWAVSLAGKFWVCQTAVMSEVSTSRVKSRTVV